MRESSAMRALKRASSSAVEAVGTALNEASDKDPDVESVVVMGANPSIQGGNQVVTY